MSSWQIVLLIVTCLWMCDYKIRFSVNIWNVVSRYCSSEDRWYRFRHETHLWCKFAERRCTYSHLYFISLVSDLWMKAIIVLTELYSLVISEIFGQTFVDKVWFPVGRMCWIFRMLRVLTIRQISPALSLFTHVKWQAAVYGRTASWQERQLLGCWIRNIWYSYMCISFHMFILIFMFEMPTSASNHIAVLCWKYVELELFCFVRICPQDLG
jgi:hypothetical protein